MGKLVEKKALRLEIRKRKAEMSDAQRDIMSSAIAQRLENMEEWSTAGTVLLFWSMEDEVNTRTLIGKWWQCKRIVLPVVRGEELELRRYDPKRMKAGYKGILEPDSSADMVSEDEIDLAIIPGMAFDAACNRLGRGGGFYDRLLPLLKCRKLGLCFDAQIVEGIPMDIHDCKVDKVLTETKLFLNLQYERE